VTNEIARGFAVTFRQFYEQGERASFQSVHGLLAQVAGEAWDEAGNDWEQLKLWRKAHGQLRAAPLRVLVGRKLSQETGSTEPVADDHPPFPQELVSLYQYGDLLHWGRQRADLSALTATRFDEAWQRHRFHEAVAGLAHLYIGFSGVVRAVLGPTQTSPPN
jgi:hypothetical protein